MTYGAFRFGLIARIMNDGLTPADVAEALRLEAHKHARGPSPGAIEAEAAWLDLAGSDWGVAHRLHEQRALVAERGIGADSSAF